jgi:hypothetical protein
MSIPFNIILNKKFGMKMIRIQIVVIVNGALIKNICGHSEWNEDENIWNYFKDVNTFEDILIISF